MKRIGSFAAAIAFVAISAFPVEAKKCPADSVQVGTACVDAYEASVWSTTDASLVKKIQKGKIVDAVELIGATQHGISSDDYGAGCPDTAAGCTDYYAVSIPNTPPSASITWFQAQAACRNAGKRLATNAEWQAAAYGTPDPGSDNGTTDCNVLSTFANGLALELRLRRGRIRHGRQPLRMGRRLGGQGRRLRGLDECRDPRQRH